MAFYENVFIARQDISAAQVDSLADQFTELLKEHGGEVKKREYWGLKNLAFRIKKNRKGHYVLLNIEAPAEALHELERTMRINEDVIRYLTVKVKELEEEPSMMMRSRGGRDDRGRDGRRFGGRGRDDRGGRHRDGPRDGPRGESRDGPRGESRDGPPRGESRDKPAAEAKSDSGEKS